jgi:hypothetical protein
MANEYYEHGSYPTQGAQGSSAAMRAELASIEAGFNKLPPLATNNNKLLKVNASGTGMAVANVIGEDGVNAIIAGDLIVSGGEIGQNAGQRHTIPQVANDVFALLQATQTLLNKTINLTNNTLTGTFAQFNNACSDADFVGLTNTQTLTNKTLDLANNTLAGTLTQFNTALSGDDFAGLAATQTLTNKTINLTSNNLVGVVNGSNALAGQIGEYIESSILIGSAIALTTGVAANVTSISLTAGDWDISGIVRIHSNAAGTSFTQGVGSISLTSATLDPVNQANILTPAVVPGAGINYCGLGIPSFRVPLGSTTTIFLVARAAFTVSTAQAYGVISARRRR